MKRLIQFHALPNIGNSRKSYNSVKEWISANRYTSVSEQDGGLLLRAYDFDELVSAISYDFQRFAFSSYESMELSCVERNTLPATSWPLLKSYYSGFFGAHAILNSVGLGEIYLNAVQVRGLTDYANLTGSQVPQIEPGSFTYKVVEATPDSGLLISQSNGGQGVHDGFWKRLCDHFSNLLQTYVASGAPSSNEVVGEVDKIQNLVRNSPQRGIWLSNTRNEINYQHRHNCWLPNTRTSERRNLSFDPVYESVVAWSNLDSAKTELERFLFVSRCFSSLCTEMVEYYVNAHGGNSPVARKWNQLKRLLDCQN